MKKLIVLTTVIVILLSFCACSNGFSQIKADDVEKMTISTHRSLRELTKEECDLILEQYNQSVYGRKVDPAIGGGTPNFNISIALKNGNDIALHDAFIRLEFSIRNKIFYIENEEFYDYVKELAEQLDKQL